MGRTDSLEAAPMRYVLAYLLATLGLFVIEYGPHCRNLLVVLAYVVTNFVALYIGWKLKPRLRTSPAAPFALGVAILWILRAACVATVVISLNNMFAFYSSLSQAISHAADPGGAYEYVKYLSRNGIDSGVLNESSILGVCLTSLTFAKYVAFGFAILYWDRLRGADRLLAAITLCVYLLQAAALGAMVNIGTLFIAVAPFAAYVVWRRPQSKRLARADGRLRRVLTGAAATGAVLLSLMYFLGSREVFTLHGSAQTSTLLSGLLGLAYYVSHGYVGLSGCLELTFVFTWGHTAFRGLAEVLLPHLGMSSHFAGSYLARNELATGWSALRVWSTIFPWLASDFTFWTVPAIFLGVGYGMRRVWRNAVTTGNPFALALMGQLLIFCFMIPANNQLFNTFGNSVATLAIGAMYVVSRRRQRRAFAENMRA